jgi:hypothetical protein
VQSVEQDLLGSNPRGGLASKMLVGRPALAPAAGCLQGAGWASAGCFVRQSAAELLEQMSGCLAAAALPVPAAERRHQGRRSDEEVD